MNHDQSRKNYYSLCDSTSPERTLIEYDFKKMLIGFQCTGIEYFNAHSFWKKDCVCFVIKSTLYWEIYPGKEAIRKLDKSMAIKKLNEVKRDVWGVRNVT